MRNILLILIGIVLTASVATQAQAVVLAPAQALPSAVLKNNSATPAVFTFQIPSFDPVTQNLDVTSASLNATMTDLERRIQVLGGGRQNSIYEYANIYSTLYSPSVPIVTLDSYAGAVTGQSLSAFLTYIEQDNGSFSVSIVESATGNKQPEWNDGAILTALSLDVEYTITNKELPPQPHAAPEPATMSLMGIGLAGVGLLRRRHVKV